MYVQQSHQETRHHHPGYVQIVQTNTKWTLLASSPTQRGSEASNMLLYTLEAQSESPHKQIAPGTPEGSIFLAKTAPLAQGR